jgi:cytochrome c55X
MTSTEGDIQVGSPVRSRLAPLLVGALGYIVMGTVALPTTIVRAEVSMARQTELIELLRHECGACHGLRLQGGLGPGLTAQRLAERSEQAWLAVILDGRAGTAMPPWRPFLTQDEVRWLIRYIKGQHGDG